jgi:hypothetical protein
MAHVFLAAIAVCAASVAVHAQSRYAAAGVDDERVDAFLEQLQRASARNDRQAIAAMIQYPIAVIVGGGLRVPVENAAALIERYDVIFTPDLKEIIAHTRASAGRGRVPAKYPLGVTPDGLVIGRNALLIKPIAGSLKITSITVPAASSSVAHDARPVERASAGSARSARQQEPQRILFRAGQRSRQFSGALSLRETDSFIVWAKQGQLLEIRVDGVRGRDIVARVRDAASQSAIDTRAAEGTRAWTGRVGASGDYRIDVVRLASAGEPLLPYLLIVSLK